MDDTHQGRRTKDSSQKSRNVRTFSSASYLAKLMGELDRAAICQRIGKAREQAGLTQPEMGEALDPPVHWRTIQTWESVKEPRVPWGRLDELATLTGVTKEWLLHGDEQASSPQAAGELRDAVETIQREASRMADAAEQIAALLQDQKAPAARRRVRNAQ